MPTAIGVRLGSGPARFTPRRPRRARPRGRPCRRRSAARSSTRSWARRPPGDRGAPYGRLAIFDKGLLARASGCAGSAWLRWARRRARTELVPRRGGRASPAGRRARSAAVGIAQRGDVERSIVTAAPAAGPSAIDRRPRGTFDDRRADQRDEIAVQGGDARPVGVLGTRCYGVAGRDLRLDRIGAGPPISSARSSAARP